jgi:hypothetical protein
VRGRTTKVVNPDFLSCKSPQIRINCRSSTAASGYSFGSIEAEKGRRLLTPLFLKGDPLLDDEFMRDPASRRRWLLTKALETAPLGEALALAQAAEDFISGMVAQAGDRAPSGVMRAPTVGAGVEAEATQRKLLSVLPVRDNRPPIKNDQPAVMSEALTGLTSLAAIDDVILYLQLGGEVFAENESADELLVRANLKRTEQGLPPFALLPTPPTRAADKPEKVPLPRPPSRRERAEWARSVVALPTA